ncbi:hypothetical protein CLV47_10119 [Antricoccus suffuscus]|uniref:YtxH-like protein n=1 Tax=Antricoccus suffuscus TaxID=1629062 RepID=A0A2T1A5K6_9ACTN|nr:hypothetical protein [Antricoccus suffuscus]PRZ43895.1 hypothetical protein CLV47_10119 [Antricoccus suffuscus]
MMGKVLVAGAAAAGYVLGSRAGRARYEQIVSTARKVRRDPRVKEATHVARGVAQDAAIQAEKKLAEAVDVAREKAPEVQEKLADAAKKTLGHGDGSGAHG